MLFLQVSKHIWSAFLPGPESYIFVLGAEGENKNKLAGPRQSGVMIYF